MRLKPFRIAMAILAYSVVGTQAAPPSAEAKIFEAREKDWRNGAIRRKVWRPRSCD